MRKGLVVLAGVAASLIPLAAARAETPTPEPNFAAPIVPGRGCVPQVGNANERGIYKQEGWAAPTYARYPGSCQRLKFAFGPITVKPGQNDVLVEPITIEKPSMDGYITRFRPDLVDANGNVPPIEQVHLHHGTWLSVPNYGTGPFFAAGEEKTIAPLPRGYGLPIRATDQWQLLYMVHSAIAQPTVVYITYEVDFVPKTAAQRLGIRPAYPVWLDVRPSGYPVFNVQRGSGNGRACTWPRQECAPLDPWGLQSPGQGKPASGPGEDWRFPQRGGSFGEVTNFQGGTLIAMGGHLHPGGITNDIDLVRGAKAKRIYTGIADYWDRQHPTKVGGPPTSWDFSMRVTGLPRWGVRVKPGDVLRSNATYDTTIQSTYENMGIAVTFLAPDLPNGKHTAKGIDPFKAAFDPTPTCVSGGLSAGSLCDKGAVTHGHLPEASNFGYAGGTLSNKLAGPVSQVDIAGFTYLQGDLSLVPTNGIPTVKLGQQLKFVNEDAGAGIYHTITTCAYPCMGPTGISFPLANGRSSLGRSADFDSAELGFGLPYVGPAKNAIDWNVAVTRSNGFDPGSVLTYYCRIHPFMRGALAVQK